MTMKSEFQTGFHSTSMILSCDAACLYHVMQLHPSASGSVLHSFHRPFRQALPGPFVRSRQVKPDFLGPITPCRAHELWCGVKLVWINSNSTLTRHIRSGPFGNPIRRVRVGWVGSKHQSTPNHGYFYRCLESTSKTSVAQAAV